MFVGTIVLFQVDTTVWHIKMKETMFIILHYSVNFYWVLYEVLLKFANVLPMWLNEIIYPICVFLTSSLLPSVCAMHGFFTNIEHNAEPDQQSSRLVRLNWIYWQTNQGFIELYSEHCLLYQ